MTSNATMTAATSNGITAPFTPSLNWVEQEAARIEQVIHNACLRITSPAPLWEMYYAVRDMASRLTAPTLRKRAQRLLNRIEIIITFYVGDPARECPVCGSDCDC